MNAREPLIPSAWGQRGRQLQVACRAPRTAMTVTIVAVLHSERAFSRPRHRGAERKRSDRFRQTCRLSRQIKRRPGVKINQAWRTAVIFGFTVSWSVGGSLDWGWGVCSTWWISNSKERPPKRAHCANANAQQIPEAPGRVDSISYVRRFTCICKRV